MAKKKPKKTGAPTLPGVEGAGTGVGNIPEINVAASEYKRVRDRRQKLTTEEVEKKATLSALMHEHESEITKDGDGILRYITDDEQEVIVAPAGESVKVRSYKDPGDPGSED